MAELEPSSLALRQLSEGIERLRTLLTAHAARGVESVPPRVEGAPVRLCREPSRRKASPHRRPCDDLRLAHGGRQPAPRGQRQIAQPFS